MPSPKKKIALVCTTIFNGSFLDTYTQKAEEEDLKSDIAFFVIPDLKTPKELYTKCNELQKKGFDIHCPTVEQQDQYLKKLGSIKDIIPYNSDNRRNIGYLMAYESGADILVSIDDDNYPFSDKTFFSDHANSFRTNSSDEVINSKNHWFNICTLMETRPAEKVFPRGYPYYARHEKPLLSLSKQKGDITINAGLWLNDPDVDAITWLANNPKTFEFSGQSIILGNDTWSPINTQNTSMIRDVIPSYYFIKMGYDIGGLTIDRYGDIFSGFFAQKCAKHLGHKIRIGDPVVDHRRNSHNYLKDVSYELACILVLEDMLKWLVDVKLEGSTYKEAYLSLADEVEHSVHQFDSHIWNDTTRGYFFYMTHCMRTWVDAINTIDG